MNLKKVQDVSKAKAVLKQIKDTAIKDGYKSNTLVEALENGVSAEQLIKECDTLLDSDTKKAVMDELSDKFNLPETLDSNILDYCASNSIDLNDAVTAIDNSSSVEAQAKFVILDQFEF